MNEKLKRIVEASARAEGPGLPDELAGDLELLAALRQGDLSPDDVSEQALGRLQEALGTLRVTDALRERPPPRPRVLPMLSIRIAAGLMLFVGVAVLAFRSGDNREVIGSRLELPSWRGSGPFASAKGAGRIDERFSLPQNAPKWSMRARGARGARGGQLERWLQATVVIEADSGFASGTLVGPRRLLTSWAAVATEAQAAAVTGQPGRVRVYEYGRKEHMATVVAGDPRVRLAVLRLEAALDAIPFSLSRAPPQLDAEVVALGSTSDDVPWDSAEGVLLAADDRTLRSDCDGSAGFSGGPLVDLASGKLVGVTLASEENGAGARSLHASGPGLTRLATTPASPIPFDVWTAGLPGMTREQAMLDTDDDGHSDSVLHRLLDARSTVRAAVLFFKIETVSIAPNAIAGDTPPRPFGLWGFEDRGDYRFDLVLVMRRDGVTALGRTDRDGVLDRVAVDHDENEIADVLWTRSAAGAWKPMVGLRHTLPAALELDAAQRTALLRVIARM